MPYTFGAGTGDDINWSMGATMGAASRAQLLTGWWLPTTLTATRGLWSAGNVFGAEVDTVTDELRLRTDNTTDGQWTTTGVDLAVGQWKFLAFLSTQNNTGPASAWRVWAGSLDSPPAPVTVTQAVAPAGNFTGNLILYLGNKGTGTQAWQGDIGEVRYVATTSPVGDTHPLGIAAFGAITDEAADLVYRAHVLPAWLGRGALNGGSVRGGPSGAITEYGYWSGHRDETRTQRYLSGTAGDSSLAVTINGATWSQNGAPRPRECATGICAARRR